LLVGSRSRFAQFGQVPEGDSKENRINNILEEQRQDSKKDIIGIRVSTKSGGCNGWVYKMDFIEVVPKGDDVVQVDDITISVDPRALIQVIGTELDYVESPIASEFIFNNPNSDNQCGCGKSFSLKQPLSLKELE